MRFVNLLFPIKMITFLNECHCSVSRTGLFIINMSYHLRKICNLKTKLSNSRALIKFNYNNNNYVTTIQLNNFMDVINIINNISRSIKSYSFVEMSRLPGLFIDKIICSNCDNTFQKNITKSFQNIIKYDRDVIMGNILINNNINKGDTISFYYYYKLEYLQKNFTVEEIFNENIEEFGSRMLA